MSSAGLGMDIYWFAEGKQYDIRSGHGSHTNEVLYGVYNNVYTVNIWKIVIKLSKTYVEQATIAE